jgi:hypothetical protein
LAEILVVDDDPLIQVTVRRALEQAGHVVAMAEDGTKGLRRSRAVPALPKPFEPSQLLLMMVADCLASANLPTSQSGPDRNALSNS